MIFQGSCRVGRQKFFDTGVSAKWGIVFDFILSLYLYPKLWGSMDMKSSFTVYLKFTISCDLVVASSVNSGQGLPCSRSLGPLTKMPWSSSSLSATCRKQQACQVTQAEARLHTD